MLKEKVLKFNERNKLFAKGDRIVVGVSGGKDSVCLLDILNRCKEEYELSLLRCCRFWRPCKKCDIVIMIP